MSEKLEIELKNLQLIAQILGQHLSAETKIFFFGSRARGHAKPFSDVDILIDAGKPLSLAHYSSLITAFDESLLPYKVDVVDAHSISEEFKKSIHKELIPFPAELTSLR